MYQALLIEDSPEFQILVKATLAPEGQVTICATANEALAAIQALELGAVGGPKRVKHFDIILIDVGLPGRDGLSLCEDLRRNPRLRATPILFVTGRTASTDLVQGFAVGADDYIAKPFHPDELRARVLARIERARIGEADATENAATSGSIQDTFWKANLHFLVGRQTVMVSEPEHGPRDLSLTPNEFKILYHLVKNEAKTLSRNEILREVWGENLHVVERTVDKHICSLRRKLGSASVFVASVPGQGYMFRLADGERGELRRA